MPLTMLDLCCGRGGWSDGFYKHGFKCRGLDIHKSKYYKHDIIKADIFTWQPSGKYDVICASPLCAPFSQFNINTNGKADQRIGLDMIWKVFEIVELLHPKYFIIENVKGLAKFLPPPRLKIRYGTHDRTKYAYLWGNFPIPDLLYDGRTKTTRQTFENCPEELGYIPQFLAQGLALAIKNELVQTV